MDLEPAGEYEVEHENYLARVRVIETDESVTEADDKSEDEWAAIVEENLKNGTRIPIIRYPIYAVGVKWLPKYQAVMEKTDGQISTMRPLKEKFLILGLSHEDAELIKLVKKGEYIAHEIKDPKDYTGVII